jgi:hypothetical protein
MASVSTTVQGEFVALTSSDYDFVDRATGERRAGSSYRLWIVADDGSEVSEIKVAEAIARRLPELTRGEPVQALCDIRARSLPGGRAVTELQLSALLPVPV